MEQLQRKSDESGSGYRQISKLALANIELEDKVCTSLT